MTAPVMAVARVRALAVQAGVPIPAERDLPEETAVALVYDGTTQAVMMASPVDLEDFAIGFSLTERIVAAPGEIEGLEVVPHDAGIEVRMWLSGARSDGLAARRRMMAGPVGCGLCGIDSLREVLRPPPVVGRGARLEPAEIEGAVAGLRAVQPLHDRTHAVHAAGFYRPGAGFAVVREDVGRHNAIDKLVGALARSGRDASDGAVVLTSRVSIDMVQKAAVAGAGIIVAVSAPTAHAVRLADAAGLTLVALARGGGFDVFTHPERVGDERRSDVA